MEGTMEAAQAALAMVSGIGLDTGVVVEAGAAAGAAVAPEPEVIEAPGLGLASMADGFDDDAEGGEGRSEALETAREAARRRAAKFGVEYKEPSYLDPSMGISREDVLREEALRRAEERAAREQRWREESAAREQQRRAEAMGREGFTAGFDLFSEEELRKREARAAKFGTSVEAVGARLTPAEEERREKIAAMKLRAEKFGDAAPLAVEEVEMADTDILEARPDVDPSVPRRWDAVHVYGVDRMSTQDIMEYFQGYAPRFVAWINDSCCNVEFANEYDAKRALGMMGVDAVDIAEGPTNSAPAGADEGAVLAAVAEGCGATALKHWLLSGCTAWLQGKDHVKAGVRQPLWLRFATELDVRDRSKKHQQRGLWKNRHDRTQRRQSSDALGRRGPGAIHKHRPGRH